MIDTLTLSRELTKVGIPSAHADAIAVSANCTRAETRGVLIMPTGRGDPVPRAPRPPQKRQGKRQSILFRLLIVCAAAIGAEVGRKVASCSSGVKPVTKGYL